MLPWFKTFTQFVMSWSELVKVVWAILTSISVWSKGQMKAHVPCFRFSSAVIRGRQGRFVELPVRRCALEQAKTLNVTTDQRMSKASVRRQSIHNEVW